MKGAILFFAIMGLLGCTSTTSNTIKNRHAHYGIEPLPDSWHRKSFRNAELFFENKDTDALIYLSSRCKKLSDSPLEALTAQTLSGMGSYEIISQKPIMVAGREALASEVEVKLDGARRYVKIVVLKKDPCVFDAVFSSGDQAKYLVKDFDAMVSTLWAKADL